MFNIYAQSHCKPKSGQTITQFCRFILRYCGLVIIMCVRISVISAIQNGEKLNPKINPKITLSHIPLTHTSM